MGNYIQVLIFVITGIILIWFLSAVFIRFFWKKARQKKRKSEKADAPGAPQTCPVCSAKLTGGDQVQTTAFPSMSGSKDRLMYIKGCVYCLTGNRKRSCPVCGEALDYDDFLAARIFERNFRHSHVHIQGCSRCCKMK
ncbi:MAG: hypothetical protein LBH43_02945 [Treponema sp.]|jgi:Na+-transporting methylmalonyl-CoA/oxaloacetate decarboxylase gamma subunit|nr:hypothetical protein [Treponema sp.]